MHNNSLDVSQFLFDESIQPLEITFTLPVAPLTELELEVPLEQLLVES